MSNIARLLMSTVKPIISVPSGPAIGSVMGGGYYGGRITIGASAYDLIVAPKETGNFSDWYVTYWDFDVEGNASLNDGWTIYQNAIPELYAYMAQGQLAALTIGGFSDWYLGSKEEMEIIYRNLKPDTTLNVTTSGVNNSSAPTTTNYTTTLPAQTSVALFKTGGGQAFDAVTYLTATRGPTGKMYSLLKSFSTGADVESANSERHSVRAIRRVLVV